MRKRFLTDDHECSVCGSLFTPEAFKYHLNHELKQCQAIELKNMALETEIKEVKNEMRLRE